MSWDRSDEQLARLLVDKAKGGDLDARDRLLRHLEPLTEKEAGCFDNLKGVSQAEKAQVARQAGLRAALSWQDGLGASIKTLVQQACLRALIDEFRKERGYFGRHTEIPEGLESESKCKRIDVTKPLEKRLKELIAEGVSVGPNSTGVGLLVWRLRKVLPEYCPFDPGDPKSVQRMGHQLARVYLEVAERLEDGGTIDDYSGFPKLGYRMVVSDIFHADPSWSNQGGAGKLSRKKRAKRTVRKKAR